MGRERFMYKLFLILYKNKFVVAFTFKLKNIGRALRIGSNILRYKCVLPRGAPRSTAAKYLA